MKTRHFFLILFGLGLALNLSAQVTPRQISVNGDAEIRVDPDQAIISFGVESWSKTLDAARKDNDSIANRILKLPLIAALDKQSVQTDQVNISPVFSNFNDSSPRQITGYSVSKNFVINLKDLSKLEAIVAAVLNAGANRLDSVQFKTSKLRQYRDQARAQAIKAAYQKANDLCTELGQKVGKPLNISENSQNPYSGRIMEQNVSFYLAGGADAGASETMAIGQIVIHAGVSVSFEILDK